MYRRAVSVLMFLSLTHILFVSCAQDINETSGERKEPRNGDAGETVIEMSKVGRIHNEILKKFDENHSLANPGTLPRGKFIDIYIDAVNAVLEHNGVPARISEEDITELLEEFDRLKEQGIFDVFNPGGSNARILAGHFLQTGKMDSKDHKQFNTLVEKMENIGFGKSRQPQVDRAISELKAETPSPVMELVLDVTGASYEFWTSYEHENKRFVTLASGLDKPALINWWAVQLVLVDAAGALIGLFLGGTVGSIIGMALASIAFIMASTDD